MFNKHLDELKGSYFNSCVLALIMEDEALTETFGRPVPGNYTFEDLDKHSAKHRGLKRALDVADHYSDQEAFGVRGKNWPWYPSSIIKLIID